MTQEEGISAEALHDATARAARADQELARLKGEAASRQEAPEDGEVELRKTQ